MRLEPRVAAAGKSGIANLDKLRVPFPRLVPMRCFPELNLPRQPTHAWMAGFPLAVDERRNDPPRLTISAAIRLPALLRKLIRQQLVTGYLAHAGCVVPEKRIENSKSACTRRSAGHLRVQAPIGPNVFIDISKSPRSLLRRMGWNNWLRPMHIPSATAC